MRELTPVLDCQRLSTTITPSHYQLCRMFDAATRIRSIRRMSFDAPIRCRIYCVSLFLYLAIHVDACVSRTMPCPFYIRRISPDKWSGSVLCASMFLTMQCVACAARYQGSFVLLSMSAASLCSPQPKSRRTFTHTHGSREQSIFWTRSKIVRLMCKRRALSCSLCKMLLTTVVLGYVLAANCNAKENEDQKQQTIFLYFLRMHVVGDGRSKR